MSSRSNDSTATTLADALDQRRNALNVLRLGLAILVVVDHVGPLGGFGREPRIGSLSVGSLAVSGFFALSGYLIASSRSRTPSGRFAWHRFLRIFPAYWACIAMVVLAFGPLAWWHTHGSLHGYGGAQPLRYLVQNFPLLTPRATELPGTLEHVPQPHAWNTPLWTLQWELACYLGVMAIARLGWLRTDMRRRVVQLFALNLAAGLLGMVPGMPLGGTLAVVSRFGATFLAGTLLFLYADRLRFDGRLAVGSVGFVVLAAVLPRSHALLALPLAYACLWVGARWRTERCRRIDISYGVYIYACPVQQLLALYGLHHHGALLYFVVGLACTLPLALASFLLVERPAMRARNWWMPAPIGLEPAPVPASS